MTIFDIEVKIIDLISEGDKSMKFSITTSLILSDSILILYSVKIDSINSPINSFEVGLVTSIIVENLRHTALSSISL